MHPIQQNVHVVGRPRRRPPMTRLTHFPLASQDENLHPQSA